MKQDVLTPRWNQFIRAVKCEVVPALGCTEPISLALACAVATSYLGGQPEEIHARVSPNLMKNGMGVTVPGTGMVGLPIAAAAGALGGDPTAGLEVLKGLSATQVKDSKKMLDEGRVHLGVIDSEYILYAEAKLIRGSEWVQVCIAECHTQIVRIVKNGEVILDNPPLQHRSEPNVFEEVTTRHIYRFATEVPYQEIAFILHAAKLNSALSQEGQRGRYGLHIGATLQRQVDKGLLGADLLTKIMIETTSASDARMGGATLPAMSNSGSGNQGITATLPVVVVADYLSCDQETLARALMLSHLMAIFIHSKLPTLSALCAATTAAMGAAAGMAWLFKKDYQTVSMAISSMVGDISGMICDGASNSCAMKVSTSVSSAYKAVLMAMEQSHVTGNEGIVAHDADDSIDNLCSLACRGLKRVDEQILQIMLDKHAAQ